MSQNPRCHTFVDALRGFALLGILLVNIEYIVQPSDLGFLHFDEPVDKAVRWTIIAFGQAKIYPIFALLFGYGLSIQISRSTESGDDLRPRYRRRMIGLAVLGVLHGVLFFPGDILVIYAAVGALAYRFGRYDTARLLKIAAWTYGTAAVGWLLVGALDATGDAAVPTVSAETMDTLANGTFLEVVGLQFFYWLATLAILSVVQGPAVFACFLAGIALGRSDLLSNPTKHQELARHILRWAPLGLAAAALGATVTLIEGKWDTLGFAIGFAAAPLVAASYLAVLTRTVGRGNGWVSRILQASGRMSLTIYLLESVVVATLSYGYGFGLFERTGPLAGVIIAVAVYLALSVFSVMWMQVARFGPFEWLLRSFTYGAPQRIRSEISR